MPTTYTTTKITYNNNNPIRLSYIGQGERSSDYGDNTAMQGVVIKNDKYVAGTNYTSITGTLLFPIDMNTIATIGNLTAVKMAINTSGGLIGKTRDIQCYVNDVTTANKLTLLTTDGNTGGTVNITWTNSTDLQKILNAINNGSLTLKMNNGETKASVYSNPWYYSPGYVRVHEAQLTFTYQTQLELSTVRYYKDGAWHPCKMHYYNGTTWVQVKPHYYTNGTWKECRVTT